MTQMNNDILPIFPKERQRKAFDDLVEFLLSCGFSKTLDNSILVFAEMDFSLAPPNCMGCAYSAVIEIVMRISSGYLLKVLVGTRNDDACGMNCVFERANNFGERKWDSANPELMSDLMDAIGEVGDFAKAMRFAIIDHEKKHMLEKMVIKRTFQ